MKKRGWKKTKKMWVTDSDSWHNAPRKLIVATEKPTGRYYFYGEHVNNSLWTGKSWTTAEEAAQAAEQAYETVMVAERRAGGAK